MTKIWKPTSDAAEKPKKTSLPDPAAAAARKSRAPCGQEPAPERTGGNKKTLASSRREGPFMPYYKKSEKPQRK